MTRATANKTTAVSKPFKVVDGKIVEIVPRGTIYSGGCRSTKVKAGF